MKGKSTPVNAEGYTRVSTLAGALDDKSNLGEWLAANAMVGMVKDPSIASQIGSLTSKYGDPWYAPEGKKALKPLIKRAQEAGGSDRASGVGTAAHEYTEVIDSGAWPEYVPAELAGWLRAYQSRMEGIEVLGSELFVVNDPLKCAGSMDKLVRMPDGRVLAADLKTGRSDPDYPLKLSVQLACYANSVRYDQGTGVRSPLHPDIDLNSAILIHMPVLSGREPHAVLYEVDIEWGLRMAELSVKVREARSSERSKRLTKPC